LHSHDDKTDKKFGLSFLLGYAIFFIILGAMGIYASEARVYAKEFWLGVLIFFVCFIMLWRYLSNKSNSQEQELQNIVDKIYNDINAGHYELALIKAKSLRYTINWSHDIKEKWDDTRESLVKIIEEKMK